MAAGHSGAGGRRATRVEGAGQVMDVDLDRGGADRRNGRGTGPARPLEQPGALTVDAVDDVDRSHPLERQADHSSLPGDVRA